MDEDSDSRGSKRRFVEIKVAVELRPQGELWVEPGAAKQVQGDKRLGNEAIPEVQGEVFINAARTSDEMVLESSDGSFSRVAAVDVRWNQWEGDVFFGKELFECCGALVVELLEFGAKAHFAKLGVKSLTGTKDGPGGAGLHGLGEDAIAVAVTEH